MAKRAKANGREIAATIQFWFRKKYNLPPTDPRFLGMSEEEMLEEFWAHHYFDNPKAAETVEDEDFNLADQLRELGDDPDDWEDVK